MKYRKNANLKDKKSDQQLPGDGAVEKDGLQRDPRTFNGIDRFIVLTVMMVSWVYTSNKINHIYFKHCSLLYVNYISINQYNNFNTLY